MPKPITLNKAKTQIDFQTALEGVAETLAETLADKLDATNKELATLLEKELPILKRWQLDGKHTLKEIAERREKLQTGIAAIRMKGIKAALKLCLSDMRIVGKAAGL